MTEDYELSDREIEIIRLVATGASNKEIAQALVISPNTVKVHLRNIFSKLGVVSRTEATMVAIRLGWVAAPINETATTSHEEPQENGLLTENETSKLSDKPVRMRQMRWLFGLPVGALVIFVIWGFLGSQGIFIQNASNQPSPTVLTIETVSASRWSRYSSIPNAIEGMAAVRYENEFLLIGGKDDANILSTVWIYDVISDSWRKGKEKPVAVREIQAALIGEKIYVPGGLLNSGNATKVLAVYDPRQDEWEAKAELPVGLYGYALATFEGKLYLFGGWDGFSYSDKIWLYDPDQDQWTDFATLPEPGGYAVAAVVGGSIHVVGGKNETGALRRHDIFFPQRQLDGEDAWESAAALPQPRYGMGISVLADMIYLAGGENETNDPMPLLQYLPPKDQWVEIDQPPVAIGLFPAVLPYETRLFVLGGAVSEGIIAENQAYQAVYTVLMPVIQ